MTISQVELDQQEDRAFLKMVLIIFTLGIIATVITLRALHLTFPSISLGQRAHRLPTPTPVVSATATVSQSHSIGGTSASPRATNSAGPVSPSPAATPSVPRPTQTNGQHPTIVPSAVPTPTSIPTLPLPSLVPLPSISIGITLPVPLPSISLGLHLG